MGEPMEHQVLNNGISPREVISDVTPGDNLFPMMLPVPLRRTSREIHQLLGTIQPTVQVGFTFNISHRTNFLLILARERQSIRLLPIIMPNVARYCYLRGK